MVLFEERQKFNQWWLWGILLASFAGALVSVWPLLGTDSFWVVALPLLIILALLAAMASFTLTTHIYHDRIEVGFTRFFTRTIRKEDIAEAAVRRYSPIGEYGGWGWRHGRNGTAYNVMGNDGLQLKLRNGKRLLIGTQRAEELQSTLDTFWSDVKLDLDRHPEAGRTKNPLRAEQLGK